MEADDHSMSQTIGDILWQAVQPFAPTSNMLVDGVYAALWKQIVEGAWQQGMHLSDSDIAAELGISRTPVRQALLQLQRAGLVQTGPRRGFRVTMFTKEEIRELYDFRTMLEVGATRAATPHIPESLLQHMRDQILGLRERAHTDISACFLRSDIELHHELIAANCGNRRLAEAIALQRAHMGIFMIGGTRMPHWIVDALNEHEAIVRALLDRDSDRAAAAMEQHIQIVKEKVLQQFVVTRRPGLRRLQPAMQRAPAEE